MAFSAGAWLAGPLPLGTHDPEVPAGHLLQSLPRSGAGGRLFPFLTPPEPPTSPHFPTPHLSPPSPDSDEALAVSYWLPGEKHLQRTQCPCSPHTSAVRRLTGTVFLWPGSCRRASSGEGLIAAGLRPEIPPSALHSGKKPSAFPEVHYKKQPHETHHHVCCGDGFRGLFVT